MIKTTMRVLFDGDVSISHGQIYIESELCEIPNGLHNHYLNQTNGMCGAAVSGLLCLLTGSSYGTVRFTIEAHEKQSAITKSWEDVVEVSFTPSSKKTHLVETLSNNSWPLDIAPLCYRVRYCASKMDEGQDQDEFTEGGQIDHYLLQLWPDPQQPDRIIKQTSQSAAFFHREFGNQTG